MNKILVPTDFSDTSLNALSYACKLFGYSELEITVLHTYELSTRAFHIRSMDNILEEDAQREMDALIKHMQEEAPNVSLKYKIIKGDSVSTIVSKGNSGNYDYIVMGTKGASGLKEVFLGSVAGGVISKTKAPVLVVPENYTYQPLREIVFATSGISLSSDSVVEPLRKLAKMSPSKINILHISENTKPDLNEVVSPIKDLNPSVTYTFGTGNINQRLKDFLQKENAELLCLVRRKKDFFSRLFDGSVTLKQTFSSSVPLLILHD